MQRKEKKNELRFTMYKMIASVDFRERRWAKLALGGSKGKAKFFRVFFRYYVWQIKK